MKILRTFAIVFAVTGLVIGFCLFYQTNPEIRPPDWTTIKVIGGIVIASLVSTWVLYRRYRRK